MKKLIVLTALITLSLTNLQAFEFGSGYYNNYTYAAEVSDNKNISEKTIDLIDDFAEKAVDEVEKRQDIIKKQIDERKESLMKSIHLSIKGFISDIIESIMDALMAPFEGLTNLEE